MSLLSMIVSFKDEETRKIFLTGKSRRLGAIARMVARRMGDLDLTRDVLDLKNPSGNRLERLKGDRAGQWSIRMNDQYRLCFIWSGVNASAVEVTDYH